MLDLGFSLADLLSRLYVMDQQGDPQLIDYATLVANAKGTDPFSVPNGASPTNQDVQNLSNAYFMYAFRAQIGLPPGYAPLTPSGPPLPDIVILGTNTASVTYNLMCSEFTIVEATYGPRGIVSWLNQAQLPGQAWIFTSKVDLRLSSDSAYGKLTGAVQDQVKKILAQNMASGAYGNLPEAIQQQIIKTITGKATPDDYEYLLTGVQDQIKNLGGNAFSVQQLLFDLDNAGLETFPVISGVTPGTPLYTCLQTAFLGAYFTALKAKGQPVLGYGISQSAPSKSTLTLTDLNMQVNPYMGTNGQPVANPTQQQQDLGTLCYLCAADGDGLPVAAPFSWNWVDASESSSYQGAIAINRNTFAKYIESQLYSSVSKNCYQTSARVWMDGLECKYQGVLSPYQAPTAISYTPTGSTVLQFSYSSESSDKAGLNGDMGQLTLNSSFTVDVTFSGNEITVVQHLVLYLRIQSLQSAEAGNIFDKTIQDTFTLSVDQYGKLNSTRNTAPAVDNSVTLSANWFINLFTDLNSLLQNFENWGKNFASTNLQDIPLNFAQEFIFPGGNTFAFQSVVFSGNQDLVSHITYIQPN